MQDLIMLKTLIDNAAKMCGSRGELANRLGVVPQHIGQWCSGARKCQPDDIAAIAVIAGFDAMEFLARATVESTDGTKKGELLKKSLGKYLLATGAAIASNGASAASENVAHLIRCIKSKAGIGLPSYLQSA